MRFLTADYLFPLYRNPIKEGVLQISDEGKVIDIIDHRSKIDFKKLEIYEGILCPGFINAHCHLELSFLKGEINTGTKLVTFINTIRKKRNNYSQEEILKSIEDAEIEMKKNGIVAVGDICNNLDTLTQKKKRNLQYYNFVEFFQIFKEKEEETFLKIKEIQKKFIESNLRATIVPHSPYTVSTEMMGKISKNINSQNELISIHVEESKSEIELFKNKKGALYDWLNNIGANPQIWFKRNSSRAVVKELNFKKLMLVHNTFSKKADFDENYYCVCPKANLYIEKTLPNFSIFNPKKLCVGTDSLASNSKLSILEEILEIQNNTDYDINSILKIASKNGAEALGFAELGTFSKGKKPGVNLVQYKNNKLQNQIKVLA